MCSIRLRIVLNLDLSQGCDMLFGGKVKLDPQAQMAKALLGFKL